MKHGSFQLMKSVNKSIVLNKIRMDEPISRADIAKETNLTPPTVSSIVNELMEQSIVRERDYGVSKGGRKPKMLHINNKAFYIIGVDAGPSTVECVLTDLAGEVSERTSSKLPSTVSNSKFISILKRLIQEIIDNIEDMENVLGIGIAMHGVVDVEAGVSLVAPNLDLRDIPIKAELEKTFQLTVKVENDARAMALGESWFGNYGRLNNMLAINLGSGVGAGLIIDGKLYHGSEDLAGEIGHMTIDIHGEQCECGNRGCLQTFAAGHALVGKANREIPNRQVNTGEEIYQIAKEGDERFIKVLQETGYIIGTGITNLIHVINPEIIVIGGGVSKSKEFILPAIEQAIEEKALTSKAKQTKVTFSELGNDATLLGAVALLLDEVFASV